MSGREELDALASRFFAAIEAGDLAAVNDAYHAEADQLDGTAADGLGGR